MAEEVHLEDRAVAWAQERGWFVRKVSWGINRRGAPDRVFIKDGRTIWIEFKKRGGSLAALQVREKNALIAAGAEWHFCDRWNIFLDIMQRPR